MTDFIRILRAGRLCLGTGLILLALWGQAIAPLAAQGQPGAAPRGLWADPAGLPAICGHAADAPSVEDRGPAAPACHACPLCAAGLSIPVVPHAPSAGRRQAWHGVAWPIPPPSPPARPHRPSGQPRAPPASS